MQSQSNTDWDRNLHKSDLRDWINIAKQYNSSDKVNIHRFVGNRTDEYRLISFSDASTAIYGSVLYIQNVHTNEVSYLQAKNRIVGKQLDGKTVPNLELSAIVLGVEVLQETRRDLAGVQNVVPINISELILYSDSLVALRWLNGYVVKLEKMNKVCTFVKNRLEKIVSLCDEFPVKFKFVDGIANPGDCISRPMSLKLLIKNNYYIGPNFLTNNEDLVSRDNILQIIVPNPCFTGNIGEITTLVAGNEEYFSEHLIPLHRYSNLTKFLRIYSKVYDFINVLKQRLKDKDEVKYGGLIIHDSYKSSLMLMILTEQKDKFPEVFNYFKNTNVPVKNIPNVVLQLNLFVDKLGLLRVGSKMMKNRRSYFPIFLPKTGILTDLIVLDTHKRLSHSGVYSVLTELRRQYWIPCVFSVVKRILNSCIHCKRYNARTIKINQGMYRDFRVAPSETPFSSIFLDHAGPFDVRNGSVTSKVYLLVITCLYTRAINLVLCLNLTVEEFLRALSIHSFEYGVPVKVFSDLGSQIVSGAEIVKRFLNDDDSKRYFQEHGAKLISFEQFYKGKKELGALVESCVKLIKRLLTGSIGKNILALRDFEYLVAQTRHLVNRRPIAFKSSLRDNISQNLPEPITPELLIHGHNLISINLMPSLQNIEDTELDPDFDPVGSVRVLNNKLKKGTGSAAQSIPRRVHPTANKSSNG